jgi:PPOX class probable F420-dependent enzyme
MDRSRIYVAAVAAAGGLGMVVSGGAFELGIGVALLLALVWRDAQATMLAGFLVGISVQAADEWVLAAGSVAVAVALWLRLRQLGYVVGEVGLAAPGPLARFARQKTIRITTYRRDGTPGGSPVSIAVDRDRAYVRSFEKAVKTRRIRRNPNVEIAPSTGSGRPTGPAVRARARRLNGAEYDRASRLLVRKHPFLHGVLVPLGHRVLRRKTGRTVHFELVPLTAGGAALAE